MFEISNEFPKLEAKQKKILMEKNFICQGKDKIMRNEQKLKIWKKKRSKYV
jgi:hypothetical protein